MRAKDEMPLKFKFTARLSAKQVSHFAKCAGCRGFRGSGMAAALQNEGSSSDMNADVVSPAACAKPVLVFRPEADANADRAIGKLQPVEDLIGTESGQALLLNRGTILVEVVHWLIERIQSFSLNCHSDVLATPFRHGAARAGELQIIIL